MSGSEHYCIVRLVAPMRYLLESYAEDSKRRGVTSVECVVEYIYIRDIRYGAYLSMSLSDYVHCNG